jgi:hypothetical protein
MLSIYDTTLSVCYPFMIRHCQYAIHLWYDTVSTLSIYDTTLAVCYPFVTTLSVCCSLVKRKSVCYPFMIRHCQYATHLCYDTVSMLSIYITTLSICYPLMLRHCQYVMHLRVNMLSIYDTTLSVCYQFMLWHCQYATHLCYENVSMLPIYFMILSVCYPYCQYAIRFRRSDEFEKVWTEIIMNKSGVVLIFPGRMWVKQRITVRVAQLYKLLHFHYTEHVVLSCLYQTHSLHLRAN